MLPTGAAARGSLAPKRASTQLLHKLNSTATQPRPIFIFTNTIGTRHFSSSPNSPKIKEFFEKKQTEKVRKTPAAWAHPVYTEQDMRNVIVAHRRAETTSDKIALLAVRVLRWGLDFATGYKHEKAISLNEKDPEAARRKFAMTEEKYMIRNLFLESVAGVPGMVAGMIRHLHSMRRMKRDNGW